jgi:periplasmic copper chaperone A
MFPVPRRVGRSVIAAGAAVVLLMSALAPASAHVSLKADTTATGSTGLLTFSFSHGCDGSATTEIAIAIPDTVRSVNPGMNYGWTIETVAEEAATPVGSPVAGDEDHAGEGRITEVIYTAKEPVPDGFYDALVLKVALPEDASGETVYFPVIQTCEDGETAWIEIPAEGQDADELESPAPSITLTDAEESGDGH